MSDAMMGGMGEDMGMPGGGGGGDAMAAIEGNRNPMNKHDAMAMGGRMSEQGVDETTPLAQVLESMGFDLNAPGLPQLQARTDGMLASMDPITQTEAVGSGMNKVENPAGLSQPMGGGAMGGGMPPPMGGGGLSDIMGQIPQ